MTRLTLLLPLILSLSYHAEAARHPLGWAGPLAYLALLAAIVLAGRLLANRAAHDITHLDLHDKSNRLSRMMDYARIAVLLLPAVGLYLLGWGNLVTRLTTLLHMHSVLLSGLLSTLPVYLAWVGLWWAQYPAERAVREAAIIQHLDAAMPVRSPPSLREYLDHQLRVGLGISLLLPVCVLLLRDLLMGAAKLAHWTPGEFAESILYLASTFLVFVLGPIALVRVMRTERIAPGELRNRLDALAQRCGVRYRDALIWHTGSTTGNAMVTGLLPQFRYVLLSDVLIESMRDDQIEAIFAHELGHIVHRHMAWYGGFLLAVPTLMLGWLTPLFAYLASRLPSLPQGDARSLITDTVATVVALAIALTGFGLLMRRFERQADVFAARAIEAPAAPLGSPVGPRGADVFSSALYRVAWLNNISVTARSWTHGSIASRRTAVESMATDATSTARFDRTMRRVRVVLAVLIVAGLITAGWIGI